MNKILFAAVAATVLAGAANADVTFNFNGGFVGAGQGESVTSPALYGNLTNVIFHFSFSGTDSINSWASDIAAVVGASQWGGDSMMIWGASTFEGGTGAGNSFLPTTFTSGPLPLATSVPFNGETTLVGWGNAYSGSTGASVGDISITLVGVDLVPTPGAAAALGLAGLAGLRRRR